MKLKKYNELFEAKLSDTLPEDYIQKIRQKASKYIGGPSRADIMESMNLVQQIMQYQQGHEAELTEIGKEIIMEHYERMLDDVTLDIKIVNPYDEEKMEMVQKMISASEDKENDEDDEDNQEKSALATNAIEYVKVPQEEIDRRKLINNIMQGEAQNVHSMIYSAKEKIDEINPRLCDIYLKFLDLNRKFDWDENRPELKDMMENMPEMGNAMETDYSDENKSEENDGKVKIKARVLDLPMLIHETVKGIYELMSAKAIPQDPVMSEKLLKKTDTLTDEEEDIKYGPYIAADLRDYLNDYLKRTEGEKILTIPNVREFIFSKMMDLSANEFVTLIKSILLGDIEKADAKIERYNIVKDAIEDVTADFTTEYTDEETEEISDDEDNELINFFKKPTPKKEIEEKPFKKEKKLSEYSQGELNNMLNAAIDAQDWDKAREIQKHIRD